MIELEEAGSMSSLPMTFREWTGNRSIESVGTTAGLAPLAFERWRSFKEAFAPEIVERAFRETPGDIRHIVDPFGGSGTTGLASQFLGVRPTMIEVNPYLADLIQAKLEIYNTDDLARSFSRVCSEARRASAVRRPAKALFTGAPKTFVEPGVDGQYIFSRDVAARIDAYLSAIKTLPSPEVQKLFRILLGSVLIPVSNVTISGKGRRYRRGWEQRSIPAERVDELFQEYVLNALFDLHVYRSRATRAYSVLRGDSRSLLSSLDEVDLSVFSPPYSNSFDYTDVYNVELWMLGYLTSSETNLQLRNATLRSHVQINRDMSGKSFASRSLTATIAALNDVRTHLWNPNIPEMISAYISDLGCILSTLREKLRNRGRIYMIVGDSRYAGIYVPVAKMLQEISSQTGFDEVAAEACRSMRSSPQHGGREELKETLLIFEKRTSSSRLTERR